MLIANVRTLLDAKQKTSRDNDWSTELHNPFSCTLAQLLSGRVKKATTMNGVLMGRKWV